MKKSLATLATLFVGCATGAAVQGLTAQTYAPSPSAQRWEQFCDGTTARVGPARTTQAINESVAAHGQGGWELVGFSLESVFPCFKRPVR
jgi:hypothetical protein